MTQQLCVGETEIYILKGFPRNSDDQPGLRNGSHLWFGSISVFKETGREKIKQKKKGEREAERKEGGHSKS